MLYINLLPAPKKRITTGPPRFTFILVLSLILLVSGSFFLQNRLNAEIDRLEAVEQRKEQTRRDLQEQLREIHQIEDKLEAIQDRIDIIQEIRSEQRKPLFYFNELLDSIPPDKIWFNSLEMQDNKNMRIEGIAMDNQAFAQFVGNLRNTESFADITLRQTSRQEVAGINLVSFQFTAITE